MAAAVIEAREPNVNNCRFGVRRHVALPGTSARQPARSRAVDSSLKLHQFQREGQTAHCHTQARMVDVRGLRLRMQRSHAAQLPPHRGDQAGAMSESVVIKREQS